MFRTDSITLKSLESLSVRNETPDDTVVEILYDTSRVSRIIETTPEVEDTFRWLEFYAELISGSKTWRDEPQMNWPSGHLTGSERLCFATNLLKKALLKS